MGRGEAPRVLQSVESRANWSPQTNGHYLEFDVIDIDDDVAIRPLSARAQTYVATLKPGAQNGSGCSVRGGCRCRNIWWSHPKRQLGIRELEQG